MAYRKNHQHTLSTQYQDLSFTKHTPLKSSGINSCSILKDADLNLHLRYSSVGSNHSQHQSQYALLEPPCPLQPLRSHGSRSQLFYKDITIDQVTKRNAYLFFNQQKNKILATKKSCQYLLPKICLKSKKAYQYVKTQNIQNQQPEQKNNKSTSKPKKEKKAKLKRCLINLNELRKTLNDEESVAGVTEKFRRKCEAQLEKISLKIPLNFGRQKCFFDMTHQQITEIYADQQQISRATQEQANPQQPSRQEAKLKKKFQLLRMDSQSSVQQNNSIPPFLMAQLSAKELFRSNNNSFVTEVPRIQNKLLPMPRLRHIV